MSNPRIDEAIALMNNFAERTGLTIQTAPAALPVDGRLRGLQLPRPGTHYRRAGLHGTRPATGQPGSSYPGPASGRRPALGMDQRTERARW